DRRGRALALPRGLARQGRVGPDRPRRAHRDEGRPAAALPARLDERVAVLHPPRLPRGPRPGAEPARAPGTRSRLRARQVTTNEDFLFAQEAVAQGFVTDAQVEEAFRLQKRMA